MQSKLSVRTKLLSRHRRATKLLVPFGDEQRSCSSPLGTSNEVAIHCCPEGWQRIAKTAKLAASQKPGSARSFSFLLRSNRHGGQFWLQRSKKNFCGAIGPPKGGQWTSAPSGQQLLAAKQSLILWRQSKKVQNRGGVGYHVLVEKLCPLGSKKIARLERQKTDIDKFLLRRNRCPPLSASQQGDGQLLRTGLEPVRRSGTRT